MTCRDLEPLIVERAAGELADADAARLDAHLAACEHCRAELGAYEETLELARLPSDEGRPVHLDTSTFGAYQRRRRRRVTGLTIGAGFVAAAVAASVVLAPALLTLRSLPAQRAAVHEAATYADSDTMGGAEVASANDITAEDAALAALDEAESP